MLKCCDGENHLVDTVEAASISLVPVLALTLAGTLASCMLYGANGANDAAVVQFILCAFCLCITEIQSEPPNEKTPAGHKKKSAQNSLSA